ncbi:ankyrin repeat domain-containing protein 13A isoform X4 [Gopherus flavomarginatus]|uniref:ankyrin repeat domain-containing protein 13A isoform X4 n=1 Tax=Gopherus flavomarginatus TaxID=286002 RepID=UPI0021CC3289|nr:ankyrin repeat domain-containing protein 13A isoform X4 [Gopherus flavomarginatus]
MSSPCEARGKFPLHVLVWNNDYKQLDKELEGKDVDQRDPRGRTLLHLAVSLGYIESAEVLLRHKADVTKENAQGWTVLHEAVSTGDPEMAYLILQHRDYHQTSATLGGVPELLQKINEFHLFPECVQMIPVASGKAELNTGGWAELIEINHDDKVVTTERFEISQQMKRLTLGSVMPERKEVERRLTSPIINTCLDTKNIAFERNTSGFWVWRTEKAEGVNGYEAKVYTANNVNVVTKIRTEHLTEEEKKRYKADRNPLESFLGTVEHEYGVQGIKTEYATMNNPTAITLEEYFDPKFDLKDRDIGRPKEVTIRTQKFKATLWMCEEFPLSLMEQVTPIIDLMARASAHFARLKDFITLEFPPGFPVKIEIPLFHVLNARITFENVNGCRTAEETSSQTAEGAECELASTASSFEVNQSVFEIPKSYHTQHDGRNVRVQDEDNEIMQFAIQQSLLESSGNKEALGMHSNGAVAYAQDFNIQYQRALQESYIMSSSTPHVSTPNESSSFDKDLQLAMELSVREQQEQEKRRREEEEEEFQQALQRSLTEK